MAIEDIYREKEFYLVYGLSPFSNIFFPLAYQQTNIRKIMSY